MIRKTMIGFVGIALLLITMVGQHGAWLPVVTPTVRMECFSVEDGVLDFEQIPGSIVLIHAEGPIESIVIANRSGNQIYTSRELAAGLLPTSEFLYLERGWFTDFWFKSNGVVMYRLNLLESDRTSVGVLGELDPYRQYYRILYATKGDFYWESIGLLDDAHFLFKDYMRVDKLQLVLLDIPTGHIETVTPSFAKLYTNIFWTSPSRVSRLLNPVPWYEHLFSPNKRYVFLYVSNGGMQYALWDNRREKILWEKEIHSPSAAAPQWSTTSDRVVYVDNGNLLILRKRGIPTHWQESQVLLPSGKHVLGYVPFNLSPNNKYLAFWMGDSEQNPQLVLYDLERNTMMNTCLSEAGISFWSPDSKWVIIEGDHLRYFLVDISRRRVLRFKFSDITPGEVMVGWIK